MRRANTLTDVAINEHRARTEVLNSGWRVPDWGTEASCRNLDPESYFPENGRPNNSLLDPCAECPVRAQCLDFALEGPWMPFGPWGGKSQTEVQRLWKERHPGDRSDVDTVLRAIGLVA